MQEAVKAANQILSDGGIPLVEVREDSRSRTSIQNAKIHAMISDIADQVTLRGQHYTPHVWKRLTTAEFLKEIGERPMIIQDLSGEILVLWEKTSKMNTKTMAAYIEWLYAFGESEGVKWKEVNAA